MFETCKLYWLARFRRYNGYLDTCNYAPDYDLCDSSSLASSFALACIGPTKPFLFFVCFSPFLFLWLNIKKPACSIIVPEEIWATSRRNRERRGACIFFGGTRVSDKQSRMESESSCLVPIESYRTNTSLVLARPISASDPGSYGFSGDPETMKSLDNKNRKSISHVN